VGSVDGGLNEEGARDGATENVGLFVGNLVLVVACEALGGGAPTDGRVGVKVTCKDGCGVTMGTIVTVGGIVSVDTGSVGLTVTFKDVCGVAVGTIAIFGAIVSFEGLRTGGRVGLVLVVI
jgi:hypothetical protein